MGPATTKREKFFVNKEPLFLPHVYGDDRLGPFVAKTLFRLSRRFGWTPFSPFSSLPGLSGAS